MMNRALVFVGAAVVVGVGLAGPVRAQQRAVHPAPAQQAAISQQTTEAARVPSRLQAEVAAEMIAPAPYGVPSEPSQSNSRRSDSQTFGDGPTPSFRVLNVPMGIDSGVAAPYSQSWADNFGGQPASSGGGELLARASGMDAAGSGQAQ